MTCFMIGCSGVLITFAQQEDYQIPSWGYFAIGDTWTVEDSKIISTGGDNTTTKLTKPITNTRPSVGWTNQQNQETTQGWAKLVLVKWFPEVSMATDIATYAYNISNGNIDFLATLKAENWGFDMHLQSRVPDRNWPNGREDSRGVCQLHRKRHSAVVDDPRFFTDYKRQVEQCWIKYKWWTRFYWYDVRHKYKTHFTIIK